MFIENLGGGEMEIKKGKKRTVIIFNHLVIKIPRIYFKAAINRFWFYCEKKKPLRAFKYDANNYASLRYYLFKGLLENWYEYICYKQNKSLFIMPTYFSFFGLFNIQKKGEQIKKMKEVDLWMQLCEISNLEVCVDMHHFGKIKNFCEENGKLKMIDYGNPRIFDVLKKYANKIYNEFDFSYIYKK